MLHSGSRNIGKELAEFPIGVARGLSHNQGLVDRDLAVFLGDTPEMAAYRSDLFWAQEYARLNRATMMTLLQDVVRGEFRRANVTFGEIVSCHHNRVAEETYDGVDLLVTRQGAIRAGSGDLGIVPGSIRSSSSTPCVHREPPPIPGASCPRAGSRSARATRMRGGAVPAPRRLRGGAPPLRHLPTAGPESCWAYGSAPTRRTGTSSAEGDPDPTMTAR